MTGGSWITHHFVYNFVESLEFLASNLRNEIRGEVGRRIPNTQNCQQITNESPRAPRNLTPPGSSDKPTWRCQQIPLIGALGIQVICYPRRAFQERLINDRQRLINPWKLARAGIHPSWSLASSFRSFSLCPTLLLGKACVGKGKNEEDAGGRKDEPP